MSFKKTQPAEQQATTYAFTPDGSCYPTEMPTDNLHSRAMEYLVRKVREGHLRPDETVLEISHQPETVQRMFPIPVLTQWSTLSSYWQWPLAWSSNPAASTIKHAGAGVPVDPKDEKAWLERLQHARRIHHEHTPPQDHQSASKLLDAVMSRSNA